MVGDVVGFGCKYIVVVSCSDIGDYYFVFDVFFEIDVFI